MKNYTLQSAEGWLHRRDGSSRAESIYQYLDMEDRDVVGLRVTLEKN